jgi:hypothetical protein
MVLTQGQSSPSVSHNEVTNSTIVTLPPSMDINDYYLANGVDATRALLLGEKDE